MFKLISISLIIIASIIDDAVLLLQEGSRIRPLARTMTAASDRTHEVSGASCGRLWNFLSFPSLFVEASSGDMDPSFRECVWHCKLDECKDGDISIIQRRFLKWDCIEECQYICMRNISDYYLKTYGIVPKYYGHWPFIRVLFMQEPAAALFSIANIIPHVYFIRKYWNTLASRGANIIYRRCLIILSFISMNAWLASVVYHTRKLSATALYDFSSALILLAFSTWLAAYRLLLELKLKGCSSYIKAFGISSVLLVGFTLVSIFKLYHESTTFSDHMKRCIGLATSQLVLWIVWFLISKAHHRYWCLLSQVWFAAAGMLEVFDFPPFFGHFDAHSLWHAATVPLGIILYHFWILDVNYLDSCHFHKEGDIMQKTSEKCYDPNGKAKVE
jgi:heme/copper-type cytochrome/quinol oxidase subunit 4